MLCTVFDLTHGVKRNWKKAYISRRPQKLKTHVNNLLSENWYLIKENNIQQNNNKLGITMQQGKGIHATKTNQ